MQIHKLVSFIQELICARVAIGFEKNLHSENTLKGQTEQHKLLDFSPHSSSVGQEAVWR